MGQFQQLKMKIHIPSLPSLRNVDSRNRGDIFQTTVEMHFLGKNHFWFDSNIFKAYSSRSNWLGLNTGWANHYLKHWLPRHHLALLPIHELKPRAWDVLNINDHIRFLKFKFPVAMHAPYKTNELLLMSYVINKSHQDKYPSKWRHNGRDGVSNHQTHDYLFNRIFKRWFPAQRASNAENVSIWWRHHEL